MSRRGKQQTLVLLGDSILDNRPYTSPEPDTATHLRSVLGDGWSVALLAQDGARMADVAAQLRRIEGRPDVAVLSVGGNDLVGHAELLDRRVTSSGDVLDELLRIAEEFDHRYEAVVRAATASVDRVILCTIYEVQFHPPVYARRVRVPLAVFAGRIIDIGSRMGLEVLDLRTVCTSPADFVMQIEPSAAGAAKIARAIAAVVSHDARVTTARVHAVAPDHA